MEAQEKMSKEVQKWADVAMFTAKPINVAEGPSVQLLSCNNDPLGTIASVAKIYKGESVTSLAQITDAERRFYLADVRKNVLAAPLEFVNFHFLISGVTRGFTHQMVRQRTATYGQESMRFAVKETMPVGYPPSLNGTIAWSDWVNQCAAELFPNGYTPSGVYQLMGETDKCNVVNNQDADELVHTYAIKQATPQQLWRRDWDECVGNIDKIYNGLINSGMPAEDARGLAPTNVLTMINYNTSLRGLLDHAGLRLCTQAQFEWRLVWMKMLEAIKNYGQTQRYDGTDVGGLFYQNSARWQFDELATIFKPICYQKGSCQFMSDLDRSCTIRDRVNDFAAHGVASSEWHKNSEPISNGRGGSYQIPGIRDEEWMLDDKAARVSQ
jgi:thymidylate synthase ThyX